jgi:hypothetical protein
VLMWGVACLFFLAICLYLFEYVSISSNLREDKHRDSIETVRMMEHERRERGVTAFMVCRVLASSNAHDSPS